MKRGFSAALLRDHLTLGGIILAALSLWQLGVMGHPSRLFLFASPQLVWDAACQDLPTVALWQDIGITLAEILGGLLLGTWGGTAAGMVLGLAPVCRRRLRPLIAFMGSIQIFTIAPLMIIWFGIDFGSKVAMATLATFFVALQQASDGIAATEEEVGAYARSLDTPAWPLMRYILLPGALYWVLSGLRLNIGFATLGALVGEFISSSQGLGHYIFNASGIYDVPRVLLGVALLCAINLILRALTGFLPSAHGTV